MVTEKTLMFPYDLRTPEEKMGDRLVEEHERDEHLWPVDACPRCQDDKPPRQQCQFCASWFEPVPGRVPSLACENCWLEIQAQVKRWQELFEDEPIAKKAG